MRTAPPDLTYKPDSSLPNGIVTPRQNAAFLSPPNKHRVRSIFHAYRPMILII